MVEVETFLWNDIIFLYDFKGQHELSFIKDDLRNATKTF